MKPSHRLSVVLALAGVAWVAGCRTDPRSEAPQDTTKYTVENTEKFVLLDKLARSAVTCTGLQERELADGRLEVIANVKNREDQRVAVQIDCVFRDQEGFGIGDETPFQSLVLPENATETVRFTARTAQAKRYTIRVRQPR